MSCHVGVGILQMQQVLLTAEPFSPYLFVSCVCIFLCADMCAHMCMHLKDEA